MVELFTYIALFSFFLPLLLAGILYLKLIDERKRRALYVKIALHEINWEYCINLNHLQLRQLYNHRNEILEFVILAPREKRALLYSYESETSQIAMVMFLDYASHPEEADEDLFAMYSIKSLNDEQIVKKILKKSEEVAYAYLVKRGVVPPVQPFVLRNLKPVDPQIIASSPFGPEVVDEIVSILHKHLNEPIKEEIPPKPKGKLH